MLLKYLPIATQQKKLLEKLPASGAYPKALKTYLETPLPDKNTPIEEVEFLALDFETTGLDAKKEAILSIGYIVIQQQRILLKEKGHFVVKVNRPISDESIAIHKITEDRAALGDHIHQLLPRLLEKMAGKVLLVHYAAIEKTFLNNICKQLYGMTLPLLMVDTLAIEQKYLQRTQQVITAHQLRLFNLRKHYGLPRYHAHNALEDALATAELFLAQVQSRQGRQNMQANVTHSTGLQLGDVLL